MQVPTHRRNAAFALAIAASLFLGGCSWLSALQETDTEPEFPQWTKSMDGSVRQPEVKKSATPAKSKSLFFNERSREVEKSIGYEP